MTIPGRSAWGTRQRNEHGRMQTGWRPASDKEWDHIRKATQQGRVVGSDAFQDEIGSSVVRRLKGETRGRPKAERALRILRALLQCGAISPFERRQGSIWNDIAVIRVKNSCRPFHFCPHGRCCRCFSADSSPCPPAQYQRMSFCGRPLNIASRMRSGITCEPAQIRTLSTTGGAFSCRWHVMAPPTLQRF